MDYYKRLLQQHHLRDTTPRRTVVAALLTVDHPLFIRELIAACPRIDRTTIYRTLETLTEIGVVHVVPFGWKQRYELAAPFRAHHHHLQCERCGAVIDIVSPELEQLISALAEQHQFTVTEHVFELRGRCNTCCTYEAIIGDTPSR